MAECAEDLISLDLTCDAKNSKGGVKKKIWITESDKVTLTLNSDGEVDTVTMVTASPANTLKTFTGKKLNHNGAYTGEVNPNVNTIKQDLNAVLYYYDQAQRDAITLLFKAEEVIAFIETEAGQIECWGYDTGLSASALTGGTGTAIADSRAITVTLSGSQDSLAKVCNFGATLADNVAYLNALT